MSYGRVLKDLIDPVFGGRVYADIPPDSPPLDAYAIYQRVGGVPVYWQEGGMPDKVNARVQIQIWSRSKQEAYLATVQVLRLVSEAPDMQVLSQPIDDYVRELKLYGSRVDISMWYNLT
ncbi:hypothetical protein [Xanthomonas phage L522]|nr:hypothetical protein [Xanthomonas phage L522]